MAAAVVLALIALGVWFGLAPEDSYGDVRAGIERTDNSNNSLAEGAPQQEVVNGWTTIEYLNLLSTQQEQSSDRRDALLLLGLLAGAAIYARRATERPGAHAAQDG